MCSLVTYTVQPYPSLHVYFFSDKIVLKCVKTHDSRIRNVQDRVGGSTHENWLLLQNESASFISLNNPNNFFL